MIRTWQPLALIAGLGGLACGTPKPPEEAAPGITTAAPEGSAAPSAAALPSAQLAAAAKLPIRESTPGKVQCETVDCDLATEVCCVAQKADGSRAGRCVAKPAGEADGSSPCCPRGTGAYCSNSELTIERRCDEAPDCPAGERCCAWGALEGDLAREACGGHCSSEKCLSGSTCPNGNRCAAGDGEAAGECPLQIKPPTCGGATCNTGEVCCWAREEGRPRCAASCDDDADAVFACTGPEQCAPHDCHTYAGMSPPKYSCGGEGFYSSILCRTLKDCPQQLNSLGIGPDSPKLRACKHSPELPPGVKECDYQ